MCEQDDFGGFAQQRRGMSRRKFGALAVGAGVAATLPAMAAPATKGRDVEIKTSDGTCDAYFVHPAKGKHAAVLIWPDIFGLRPAFKEMATRLAESGYAVLVVNPFYRTKRAPTAPKNPDFNDPPTRDALMALMHSLSPQTVQVDAPAFVSFLDQQPATDTKKKVGTTGYCMGGPLVFRTAANVPDRIGAAATFHGGGLVTDKPDSPHLSIPKMKAQFLIAIAANDDEKEPKSKDTLRDAFAQAKLPAEIEVYAGTKHGWCPTDSPVYDHDQAEKAWSRMLALFKRALA
ncbi:MAG TPA: dienelactone hydrolase family protein [Nevskiaceae bacterium]|nr:dienelactone hydrolase family protein [Nevskiaceae bacterium]